MMIILIVLFHMKPFAVDVIIPKILFLIRLMQMPKTTSTKPTAKAPQPMIRKNLSCLRELALSASSGFMGVLPSYPVINSASLSIPRISSRDILMPTAGRNFSGFKISKKIMVLKLSTKMSALAGSLTSSTVIAHTICKKKNSCHILLIELLMHKARLI